MRPRKSRSSLLLAGGTMLAVVLPGLLLFTAVSQAATVPSAVLATSAPATTWPPPTSPGPCPPGTPATTGPAEDPQAPGPICRFAARFLNNQTVVSWGAAVDNVRVTGYTLYDRFDGVVTTRVFPGQGGTIDNPPTEVHTYWVTAHDAAGNVSVPSPEVTVGDPAYVDTTPPTAPTNLAVTTPYITLTWNSSSDDTAVTDYLVYDLNLGVITVRQVPAGTTTINFPFTPTTQHFMWVVARDAAGNLSRPSNGVALGSPVCPIAGPCPLTPSVPTSYPTAVPTTPTTPATPTCAVKYQIVAQWPGGFQGNVTITNLGSAPMTAWTLDYTFPDGQQIVHLWGGVTANPGPTAVVTSVAWNATIQPGGSVWFGFNANWTGTNGAPTGFRLNGQNCAVQN